MYFTTESHRVTQSFKSLMKRGWTQIIADKNSVILSLIFVFLCGNLRFN